jgi:hypothetical protein
MEKKETKASNYCRGILWLLSFCTLIACGIIFTDPNRCDGDRETDYCNGIYIGIVLSSIFLALSTVVCLILCCIGVCVVAAKP